MHEGGEGSLPIARAAGLLITVPHWFCTCTSYAATSSKDRLVLVSVGVVAPEMLPPSLSATPFCAQTRILIQSEGERIV
jgi:hypothetical protein